MAGEGVAATDASGWAILVLVPPIKQFTAAINSVARLPSLQYRY